MTTKLAGGAGILLVALVTLGCAYGVWKKVHDGHAATSAQTQLAKQPSSFYETRCKYALEPMLPKPALDWSDAKYQDIPSGKRVITQADVGNEWHGFTCDVSEQGEIQGLAKNTD